MHDAITTFALLALTVAAVVVSAPIGIASGSITMSTGPPAASC